MSNAFRAAVEFTLSHEGGYSLHPRDPGGETNFGISRRSYPHLDIKSLSREQAADIYRRDFWERLALDDFPPALAAVVFDAAVNSGPDRSIRLLQEAVNAVACQPLVAVDGALGPKTRAAVGQFDAFEVALSAIALRGLFLLGLPGARDFGKGWSRRCKGLLKLACDLAYGRGGGDWK